MEYFRHTNVTPYEIVNIKFLYKYMRIEREFFVENFFIERKTKTQGGEVSVRIPLRLF